MRSDISPAKKYANWDTVLVLEEMEAELDGNCDLFNVDSDASDISAPKRQRLIVSTHIAWHALPCSRQIRVINQQVSVLNFFLRH